MAKLRNKKISERLLQVIKPYMHLMETGVPEQRLDSLLLVGTIAWNISVTGDRELKNILLEGIPDKEGMIMMIDKLIDRKYTLFPDDKRYILKCQINSIKRKNYDITVSFLHKDEYDKAKENTIH